LLLDFDSDDEVATAQAAVAANKGSSSSGTGTRIKSPATAQTVREETVNARVSFLRRIKGGFPAFDDDRPDPGCAYEVQHHTQAFDPCSEVNTDKIQASRDGDPTLHCSCAFEAAPRPCTIQI
jgi:hypothetical protein